MHRSWIIALFLLSLLFVGGGAFVVGNYLASPAVPSLTVVPDEIMEQAKATVPPPVFPERPVGRSEMRTVPVTITQEVPYIDSKTFELAFGTKVEVPITKTRLETIVVDQQQPFFVDATPEENVAWQASVDEIQRNYDEDLNSEVRRLVAAQQLKSAKETTDIIKTIVTDILVPLLAALAGLIGAVVGLVHAFRSPAKEGDATKPKKA